MAPDTTTDLAAWLGYIENLHAVGWDLGLDRVAAVGQRLDVLHPGAVTILVAGTNGKGSTCEYLHRFARASGLRTGLSTSPHLLTFNERIRIDGEPVSDETIIDAFRQIDDVRANITLTYFEFAALASMVIFKQAEVDVAILEIGLGGRLDAMNIVSPDISVITSIALDHQDWLGDTRDQIAIEKAGVMRRDVVTVIADPEPPVTLLEQARHLGAATVWLGRDFSLPDAADCSLPAASFAAARQVAETLGWDTSRAQQIAAETYLDGRRTWIEASIPVLLDVAHNPAAAHSLRSYLAVTAPGKKIHAVLGMYQDKDIESVTAILADIVGSWHLASMDDPRALPADDILRRLDAAEHGKAKTYDKISAAILAAQQVALPGEIVLVFGSFPVVAGALATLR